MARAVGLLPVGYGRLQRRHAHFHGPPQVPMLLEQSFIVFDVFQFVFA